MGADKPEVKQHPIAARDVAPTRYLESSVHFLTQPVWGADFALGEYGLLWDTEGNAVSGHTFIHEARGQLRAYQLNDAQWQSLSNRVDALGHSIWYQHRHDNRMPLAAGVSDPLEVTFQQLEAAHAPWTPMSQKTEEALKRDI